MSSQLLKETSSNKHHGRRDTKAQLYSGGKLLRLQSTVVEKMGGPNEQTGYRKIPHQAPRTVECLELQGRQKHCVNVLLSRQALCGPILVLEQYCWGLAYLSISVASQLQDKNLPLAVAPPLF